MEIRKGTGASFSIVGRLKAVPEVRQTKTGKNVANVVLAVTTFDGQSNHKNDSTEWFTITLWGKATESLTQYARAGMRLYFEAFVKHEARTATNESGHSFQISVPTFHANRVHFMDAIKTDDSAVSAAY